MPRAARAFPSDRASPLPSGSRAYRLRGTGAFDAVFRAGRRLDGRLLQLVAMPAAGFPGRVGYVISAKSMPRAVDRNRLRRRLRETIRAARPAIARFDVVVRVRRAIGAPDIDDAVDEAVRLVAGLVAETPK